MATDDPLDYMDKREIQAARLRVEGYRGDNIIYLGMAIVKAERQRDEAVAVLRQIAKPALGGKAQQHAAQAFLSSLDGGKR